MHASRHVSDSLRAGADSLARPSRTSSASVASPTTGYSAARTVWTAPSAAATPAGSASAAAPASRGSAARRGGPDPPAPAPRDEPGQSSRDGRRQLPDVQRLLRGLQDLQQPAPG